MDDFGRQLHRPGVAGIARQLAEQMRTRDHILAYTYSRSNEQRREHQREEEEYRKLYPNLASKHWHFRVEEQWVVLVGGSPGWPDFDNAAAHLKHIKELPRYDLKTRSGTVANDVLLVPVGNTEEERNKGKMQGVILNPLANAIVIRNPTVPAEAKAQQRFDPRWEKLNADESYSLLKNPKPWTLVVKEYQGASKLVSRGQLRRYHGQALRQQPARRGAGLMPRAVRPTRWPRSYVSSSSTRG